MTRSLARRARTLAAVLTAVVAAAACTTAERAAPLPTGPPPTAAAAAPTGVTATTAQARIEVPDVVGMVTSAARMTLLDAGLAVRVPGVDGDGTEVVS